MNTLIEGRITHFTTYFDSLSKEQQDKIIKGYNGSAFKKGGRGYCEELALAIVDQANMSVGQVTLDEIVDEMERFLESRKTQALPQWQKRILQWLDRKS